MASLVRISPIRVDGRVLLHKVCVETKRHNTAGSFGCWKTVEGKDELEVCCRYIALDIGWEFLTVSLFYQVLVGIDKEIVLV